MEGLDVVCAQNWIEQFRYNLAHHEENRECFYSHSLDSLSRHHYVGNIASDFVFYGFDWSETPQHSDGTYFGPWRNRRGQLIAKELLTR